MSGALRDGYRKLEQEIADRKQTQAALVESEEFLNTIFDSIRDPFCIIDRSYRIVRANEAYAEMKNARLPTLSGPSVMKNSRAGTAICDGLHYPDDIPVRRYRGKRKIDRETRRVEGVVRDLHVPDP